MPINHPRSQRLKKLTRRMRDGDLCCSSAATRILLKMSYRPCDGERTYGARDVLELLPEGGNISYVGDSVSWQSSRAFLLDAIQSGFTHDRPRLHHDPIARAVPHGEGFEKTVGRREVITLRSKADRQRTWRVQYFGVTGVGGREGAKGLAEYVFKFSNVVVFNVGLHYHLGSATASIKDRLSLSVRKRLNESDLRLDYTYMSEEMHEFNSRRQRVAAVFAETTPQHFSTPNYSGDYDTPGRKDRCGRASAAEKFDWRNKILRDVASRSNVSVASAFRVMIPLHLFHEGRGVSVEEDCTHYCYHPKVFTPHIDAVYRALMRTGQFRD